MSAWEVSREEVAAYLNFLEKNSSPEDPVKTWTALDDKSRREWWGVKNPADFIASLDRLREYVAWCGWPILCTSKSLGSNFSEHLLPRVSHNCLSPEQVSVVEKILETASVTEPRLKVVFRKNETPSHDYLLHEDLLHHMLEIYEFHEVRPKTRLSLPQVAHGLAFACQEIVGNLWTKKVVILNWSTLGRSALTSLFATAKIAVTILHSAKHWALLVLLRPQMEAVVYDSGRGSGSVRPGIQDAISNACQHFANEYSCEINPKYAVVPSQPDGWSCGHRVVLSFACVLETLLDNSWLALPAKIPPECFEDEWIQNLCRVQCQLGKTPTAVIPECDPCRLEDMEKHDVPVENQTEKPDRKRKATLVSKEPVPSPESKASSPAVPSPESKASSPQGSADSSPPTKKGKVSAKKKSSPTSADSKKKQKDLENYWQSELSFTHNDDFQKIHVAQKISVKKGHWNAFVSAMLHVKPMDCTACVECRDIINKREAGEEEKDAASCQVVAAEDGAEEEKPQEQQPQGKLGRRVGRPKKNAEWNGLSNYLQQHRPGVYRCLDPEQNMWFCNLCHQKLKLQRDGLTFVTSHEKRELHKAKVRLMEANMLGELPVIADIEKPCCGMNVFDESCHLFQAKESITNWMASGMPFANSESASRPSILQQCLLISSPDGGIVAKHRACTGEMSVGPCTKCYPLLHNPALVSEIQKWSWKVDLVQLAHFLLAGTAEESRDWQETIKARDYFCSEIHGKELSRLVAMKPSLAAQRVRISLCSITLARRNASLQNLISLRLPDSSTSCLQDTDKAVYRTLMKKFQGALENGTCHEDEFALASQAPRFAISMTPTPLT